MEEHRAAWQCARPPELDEVALIAVVDEEASPEVYEHLAACPACDARMQAIADLQGRLQERLYRLFCPSSDELAAFFQGQMIPLEQARLEAHLSDCLHCRDELALLRQFTSAPFIPASVIPQRRVIAQPQRSNPPSNGESSVYRAGSLQITLNIEQQQGARLVRLRGAVRGSKRGTTASLISNGRVVRATALTDHGSFVLDELAPGNFSLSLRLPDYEVVVEALRF